MPKKTDQIIEPIDTSMDDVARAVVNPRTPKPLGINKLPATLAQNPRGLNQQELFIDKQREVDGIGMGVLSDGTAFLTGRGLASLCGISSSRISELAAQWDGDSQNLLTRAVKKILMDKGVTVDKPYVEIKQRTGIFHAYSDMVCLAVLDCALSI